ncbi:MAG: periplasmic protein TonB, partial [Thermodesulfobacteriota bacterium]|nr:periplasmic protein TonB [Thermodesulfobacteriota bacterium]
MTLQAKGFQWSIVIHGAIFLIVAALQVPAVSQNKLIVIDFALSGNNPPAAVAQSSLYQAQAMIKAPERATAIRPKEVPERYNLPDQEADKLPASSEVPVKEEEGSGSPSLTADATDTLSTQGEAGAASLPRTMGFTGAPPAIEASRNAAGTFRERAGLSGNAGTGTTPETSGAAYLKEHFAYIRDRITGGITYPGMARKMGWCGQVRIAFIVCEDGSVNNVRVVESSGFSLLDRNAVDTVKNAAPFPIPPVKAEIR